MLFVRAALLITTVGSSFLLHCVTLHLVVALLLSVRHPMTALLTPRIASVLVASILCAACVLLLPLQIVTPGLEQLVTLLLVNVLQFLVGLLKSVLLLLLFVVSQASGIPCVLAVLRTMIVSCGLPYLHVTPLLVHVLPLPVSLLETATLWLLFATTLELAAPLVVAALLTRIVLIGQTGLATLPLVFACVLLVLKRVCVPRVFLTVRILVSTTQSVQAVSIITTVTSYLVIPALPLELLLDSVSLLLATTPVPPHRLVV